MCQQQTGISLHFHISQGKQIPRQHLENSLSMFLALNYTAQIHVSCKSCVYVNVGEASVVWGSQRGAWGGEGPAGVWGPRRPGVTTFAEVLLAAVITETASAGLPTQFSLGNIDF